MGRLLLSFGGWPTRTDCAAATGVREYGGMQAKRSDEQQPRLAGVVPGSGFGKSIESARAGAGKTLASFGEAWIVATGPVR